MQRRGCRVAGRGHGGGNRRQPRQPRHRQWGRWLLGSVAGVLLGFQVEVAAAGDCALRAAALPAKSRPGSEGRPAPSKLCAWARRNSDQLGPIRRGAGPRPATRKWMRTEPQRAFSRASRRIRLRTDAASGGRPGGRARRRRLPCSSARCQRRSVCGLAAKHDQRSSGSSRLTAASNARSAAVYCGRFPPRLKIATWWRRTTISSSRSPPPRASRRTQTQRSRYSKQLSKTRSLNHLGRKRQHHRPAESSFFTPQAP